MHISEKLKAAVVMADGLNGHDQAALASVLLAGLMGDCGSDSIGFSHSLHTGGETCVLATHIATPEEKKRFEKAIELLSCVNPGDALLSLENKTAAKFLRRL